MFEFFSGTKLDRDRRAHSQIEELTNDYDDEMNGIENENIDFLFESIEKEMKTNSATTEPHSHQFGNRVNVLNQHNATADRQIKNMPQAKCLNESQATETSSACKLSGSEKKIFKLRFFNVFLF